MRTATIARGLRGLCANCLRPSQTTGLIDMRPAALLTSQALPGIGTRMLSSSNVRASPKLPLSFSHMGLFCVSPERLADFYTRFLGFTVTDRGSLPNPQGADLEPLSLVFLSRDPEEHHQLVLVSSKPESIPPIFNTINQISFRADSLPTLQKILKGLRSEIDVSEVKCVTHGNAISIYFKDPEDNRLECFVDTPWYVSQPCREPIDLTLPVEEIMSFTERLARELPGFCPRPEWVERMRQKMSE